MGLRMTDLPRSELLTPRKGRGLGVVKEGARCCSGEGTADAGVLAAAVTDRVGRRPADMSIRVEEGPVISGGTRGCPVKGACCGPGGELRRVGVTDPRASGATGMNGGVEGGRATITGGPAETAPDRPPRPTRASSTLAPRGVHVGASPRPRATGLRPDAVEETVAVAEAAGVRRSPIGAGLGDAKRARGWTGSRFAPERTAWVGSPSLGCTARRCRLRLPLLVNVTGQPGYVQGYW